MSIVEIPDAALTRLYWPRLDLPEMVFSQETGDYLFFDAAWLLNRSVMADFIWAVSGGEHLRLCLSRRDISPSPAEYGYIFDVENRNKLEQDWSDAVAAVTMRDWPNTFSIHRIFQIDGPVAIFGNQLEGLAVMSGVDSPGRNFAVNVWKAKSIKQIRDENGEVWSSPGLHADYVRKLSSNYS